MPASVTTATVAPAGASSTAWAAAAASLCWCMATSRGAGIPTALSSLRVRRVSSQKMTSAPARAAAARG